MGQPVTPEQFRASLRDDGPGRVRLVLEGELDMATAPIVASEVAEACTGQPAELVIDLKELTFCGSSGIREFVRAAEVCAGNHTNLRMVGVSRGVHQVFAITGLMDMFTFEP
jgi:anti-anti-sigma factor